MSRKSKAQVLHGIAESAETKKRLEKVLLASSRHVVECVFESALSAAEYGARHYEVTESDLSRMAHKNLCAQHGMPDAVAQGHAHTVASKTVRDLAEHGFTVKRLSYGIMFSW